MDEAFKVSERAIAANPYDPDLLGQLGQLMGMAGRTDDGRALVERALVLNPENSPFYRGFAVFHGYAHGAEMPDASDAVSHAACAILYFGWAFFVA